MNIIYTGLVVKGKHTNQEGQVEYEKETANIEYEIKESFRCHMFYENIKGESFQPTSLENLICWFYACVLAAGRGKDIIIWDDFVDWCDDNPQSFNDFVNWYMAKLDLNKLVEPQEEDKPKKKSKKEKSNPKN